MWVSDPARRQRCRQVEGEIVIAVWLACALLSDSPFMLYACMCSRLAPPATQAVLRALLLVYKLEDLANWRDKPTGQSMSGTHTRCGGQVRSGASRASRIAIILTWRAQLLPANFSMTLPFSTRSVVGT